MAVMEAPLVLSREQVRQVDVLAVQRYGMSSLVLMENAGRGVADALLDADPSLLDSRGRGDVIVICGKGNNAGDGFVIARHLEIRGMPVKALLLVSPDQLRGDARANYEILARSDVPIIDASSASLAAQLDEHAGEAAWLVDAMLGTGASGEPREPFATAIKWMNAQAARRLAVDLPSGLDCDMGEPAAATVRADLTCTFVAMKPGFLLPQAKPFFGEVRVVSIGVPPRLVREAAGA
jgi:NAD(P)H-hydrate epimerase